MTKGRVTATCRVNTSKDGQKLTVTIKSTTGKALEIGDILSGLKGAVKAIAGIEDDTDWGDPPSDAVN